MAFTVRNLSVLAYAQGFTLWHYAGKADRLEDTTQPGFFDPAADLLSGGDMMLISARDGGGARLVQAEAGRVATLRLG
jgi:hypothetical protein